MNAGFSSIFGSAFMNSGSAAVRRPGMTALQFNSDTTQIPVRHAADVLHETGRHLADAVPT